MPSSVDVFARPERPRASTAGVLRDLLLAIPFLALIYVELAHHILWRDELNALAITWASPTIPSLFWHIHHEGHPWLWYVMLWIPSRFTQSLLVLKVVQGIVSTAIILFVALRSPFRRWEKALVLVGYFFVFEYTVLSRMYGVMLLLFVVYMWRRTNRPAEPILTAAVLGLLASSDNIGMILSIALILEYAYTAYAERNRPLFSRRTALLALGIYAALAAFAVWSAKPAKDISWRTTGHPFGDLSAGNFFDALLRYTVLPFFPVRSPRSHFFWDPEFHRGSLFFLYAIPMLFVLGMLYAIFRRHKGILLLLAATILAGTALGYLIYPGSERHFGVVFLAFLAGVWILRAEDPAALLPIPAYILLAISALSSVWAVIGSWQRPFSYDKAAAEWIVRNHLERMPFVAEEDTSAISVAEYLHRPVYMIECSCVDTYLLFSSRRDNYKNEDAPMRILQAEHFYHDRPLLFMLVHPMKSYEEHGLEEEGFEIQPLASFSEAEAVAENFYFYRLTLTNPKRLP